MSRVVLDASPVIALLRQEKGAAAVTSYLSTAVISAVNLAEVVSRMIDEGMSQGDIERAVKDLSLDVVPFDQDLALEVGRLRPSTRHLGLSLGDRACLALARREGVPALTADRTWGGLDIGVEIRLIRD